MVSYERDDNENLVSDGALAIYTNSTLLPVDGMGQEGSTFYAILGRTQWLSGNDTLVLMYPFVFSLPGILPYMRLW
jgi:hypothetical protein